MSYHALIQFRESIFNLFKFARDAAMNLLDALCSFDAKSVIELSLSPFFERSHASIPRAIQDYSAGRQGEHTDIQADFIPTLKEQALSRSDLPYHMFAIDVSPIPRPYAAKLEERQIVHANNPTPGQKPISVGHQVSCVAATAPNELSLPLSLKRVPFGESQTDFGLEQAETVGNDINDKPCLMACDAKYSNRESLYRAHGWNNNVLLSRLSGTRIFYQYHEYNPKDISRRGPKPKYGAPFKLSEPDTHPVPDESIRIIFHKTDDTDWRLNIERFDNLLVRGKKGLPMHDKPMSVFKVAVFDRSGQPLYKEPLWLVGVGCQVKTIALEYVFLAYHLRFDIEHWFRFAKGHLLLDQFQSVELEHIENWLLYPMLATHQLDCARDVVTECHRPWEATRQDKPLAAAQIKRGMSQVLHTIGTPAAPPKPRGRGGGRVIGSKNVEQREKSPIQFKSPKKLFAGKVTIKFPIDSVEGLGQAKLNVESLPEIGKELRESLKTLLHDGKATLDFAKTG